MKKIAFTLVLNGMPFIKRQAQIIPNHFDKWYIIEGVTKPHHDTSWCTDIDSRFFSTDKLSVDGTTEFLDKIASDKISVIRKHDFWDGKREMCNSFMAEVSDCILMEFDVDEIWQDSVLSDVLGYAEVNDNLDYVATSLEGPAAYTLDRARTTNIEWDRAIFGQGLH